MEDLISKCQQLKADYLEICELIGVREKLLEIEDLRKDTERPDLWSNQQHAQEITKKISKLESRFNPWKELGVSIEELCELSRMRDEHMQSELEEQYNNLDSQLSVKKTELKFSGQYDDKDAVINISAGAGGTDAQDWSEILERMYLRYFEKKGYKVSTIDRSPGEEAGIKSVLMEVSGDFVYAHLKGEHGVHRLVRLSPFNADSLRQTSFAKVEVVPLIEAPEEVEISDKDLKIDVYRSGGRGGQSVNTTDSAVRITHLPTGVVVAIQNERSQVQNREKALQILRSKLAKLIEEQHKTAVSELKGPNEQASWGNQIRNYVQHPYKLVKDTRTGYETSDIDGVLGGDLDAAIEAYLTAELGSKR